MFHPQLAQGAAFAAKARQRAGNLTDYTDLATKILCGLLPPNDAARAHRRRRWKTFPTDSRTLPGYEIWRRRIQNHFMPNHQLQEA